jgi:hypothetical protein
LYTCAIEQVEGYDTAPAPGSKPGQEKHVWVEKSLAALPSIRGGRVNIEVPQKADMQRLKVFNFKYKS